MRAKTIRNWGVDPPVAYRCRAHLFARTVGQPTSSEWMSGTRTNKKIIYVVYEFQVHFVTRGSGYIYKKDNMTGRSFPTKYRTLLDYLIEWD
jgi:hypothetical protein